tara:strand:- start:198 stop:374 length:177 start_codon:yes stop_codon:yes gene_type:complete
MIDQSMVKDAIIKILDVLEAEFKKRIEQSPWEQDRDLWSKWHDQIREMLAVLRSGGIK